MQRPKQTRILSAIEGYPSTFGGLDVEGSATANTERMDALLRSYPGHWFLVGGERLVNGQWRRFGSTRRPLQRRGYDIEQINNKIYARVPHPDGLPIEALVERRAPWMRSDKLPELAADGFGWSKGELSDALATAQAWLFPTEGIQAA